MGQRFVTSLKLPPTPKSDSWSQPHSRALSDRPPVHLQNTIADPSKGHHFDQIPIHPAGLSGGKSAATSPPAGGLHAREDGELDELAGAEGAEVTLTTTISDSRVVRRPEPTTPDGGASEGATNAGKSASSGTASAGPTVGLPSPVGTVPCNCVESLDSSGSGAIEGSFGIGDYWKGVTPYWGDDKTLGMFDEKSGSGRLLGHKFQVVGTFKPSTGTAAAEPTFQQMAQLSVGKEAPGKGGGWFNDMDYTDPGGGKHHWDPNAEAGTTVRKGYPGVRRTIANNKYAYTDPPAIFYKPGKTNTYRDLNFNICFKSPIEVCACNTIIICFSARQEIEVKKGVPSVLKAP